MGKLGWLGLAVACVLFVGGPAECAKQDAVQAAESWLALVDAGKYDESWQHAAAFFRNALTSEQWQGALKGARSPMGAVTSRKLTSAVERTQLPGAPDGHYVVIQYQTVFEHKAQTTETVTPMQEPDGAWKVSGYQIR